MTNQDQPRIKPDNAEKFDNSRHKIRNNSIAGKTPVWIASERMTVYVEPGKDIEAVKRKWENREPF